MFWKENTSLEPFTVATGKAQIIYYNHLLGFII